MEVRLLVLPHKAVVQDGTCFLGIIVRYGVETAQTQYRPPLRSGEEATLSCQAGRLSPLSALRNRQERVQASDREDLIDLCVEVA